MVLEQLVDRGIKDRRVIKAMQKVERHRFVPEEYRSVAYGDHPLPIGYEQTISQPYVVAFMTEVLQLKPTDRVLEIGTGSGYQAAILAEICDSVFTIEIVPELAHRAKNLLEQLGYKNIQVKHGDGYQGWPEKAPFDAIIVTCSPTKIPQPLKSQLKEGGRMIIPVGYPETGQELYLIRKENERLIEKAVLPVRFVPMVNSEKKNY
jgi:protein-L-isoaspartate(D-aspartate) O-methyltransferase